jgi:hypothetical protein
MANYYWRGATSTDWQTASNWRTASGGGGSAHTTLPTSADDVFFNGTALANCSLNAASYCNDINFTGFTRTFTHTAHNLDIYGNLTVVAGMTYTISNGVASTIVFRATATGKTITSGGKTLPTMTFNGVGGGWTLQDALTITSNWLLVLTNGNLNTNGKTVSCGYFLSNNSNTRTLTLGASTINVTGTTGVSGQAPWYVVSTNLTLSAASSTINSTGANTSTAITFSFGSSQTYGTVSITGKSGLITMSLTSCTFTSLTLGTAATQDTAEYILSGNITATTFNPSGNSSGFRNLIRSHTFGTAITITANAITGVTNVDFEDITAPSGVNDWNVADAGNSAWGNCGGCTNITFSSARQIYCIAGGNWTAAATWSTTSGGAPTTDPPRPQDIATIDSSSGGGTLNLYKRVSSVTCNSAAMQIYFDNVATFYAYGYLSASTADFGKSVTATTIEIRGYDNTGVWDLSGDTFPLNIIVRNRSGIVADFHTGCTVSGTLQLISGTINFEVPIPALSTYTYQFQSINISGTTTRSITTTYTPAGGPYGAALVKLTSSGTVWDATTTTNLTYSSPNNLTLECTDTTSTQKTLVLGGLTYTRILFSGSGTGTYYLNGSATITTLESTKTNAYQITFKAGATITLSYWKIRGSSGNAVTLTSDTFLTIAYLALSGGNGFVESDWLVIYVSSASPSTETWYAGANSTNGGLNAGWIFTDWVMSTKSEAISSADVLSKGTISPRIRDQSHTVYLNDVATRVNRAPLIPRNIYHDINVLDSSAQTISLRIREALENIFGDDVASTKATILIQRVQDILADESIRQIATPLLVSALHEVTVLDILDRLKQTILISGYNPIVTSESTLQYLSLYMRVSEPITVYDALAKINETILVQKSSDIGVVDLATIGGFEILLSLYEELITDDYNRLFVSLFTNVNESVGVSTGNNQVITPLIISAVNNVSAIDILTRLKQTLIISGDDPILTSEDILNKLSLYMRVNEPVTAYDALSKIHETILIQQQSGVSTLEFARVGGFDLLLSICEELSTEDHNQLFVSLYMRLQEIVAIEESSRQFISLYTRQEEVLTLLDQVVCKLSLFRILSNESVHSVDDLTRLLSTILVTESNTVGLYDYNLIKEYPLKAYGEEEINALDYHRIFGSLLLYGHEQISVEEASAIVKYIAYVVDASLITQYLNYPLKNLYPDKVMAEAFHNFVNNVSYHNKELGVQYLNKLHTNLYLNAALGVRYTDFLHRKAYMDNVEDIKYTNRVSTHGFHNSEVGSIFNDSLIKKRTPLRRPRA